MKLRNSGQALLAAAATIAVGFGMISCGASNTVDYVYVTSNKNNPGQINVYKADSESGVLKQIPDSPYPSGGRNPVADVASPNGQNLYVINRDDNTIVEFIIGTDGKLYPQHTCNTPGTEPSALAISPDGSLLFVVDFYQAGFTDINPGPGGLVVYNIQSDGSLGTAPPSSAGPNCQAVINPAANSSAVATQFWPLSYYPGNVTVTGDGSHVYVADSNAFVTTTTPSTTGTTPQSSGLPGQVHGFAIGSGGVLSSIAGSPWSTGAGSEPLGIIAAPGSGFLYVLDAALNQIYNYAISPSTGALTAIPNGATTPTGTFPVSGSIDPTGTYLYVSNYGDGTVGAYTIASTGVPAPNSATPSITAGHGATCTIIDPSLNRFVFTSNFIDGSISSATANTSTGGLVTNQNSPYATSGQPTCVAAIPHNKPTSTTSSSN